MNYRSVSIELLKEIQTVLFFKWDALEKGKGEEPYLNGLLDQIEEIIQKHKTMTTPHHSNDQESHPVPGINRDINGKPLTAPTDKDSLGVDTSTALLHEWHATGCEISYKRFLEERAANWQARAEQAEKEFHKCRWVLESVLGCGFVEDFMESETACEQIAKEKRILRDASKWRDGERNIPSKQKGGSDV